MQKTCTAVAKLTVNKKLNTFRILFSFDKYNTITVHNAALVTGDICDVNFANAEAEITKAVAAAKYRLSVTKVQFV